MGTSEQRKKREAIESVFWEDRRGLFVALALVALAAGILLFSNLSSMGIWEPWEAHEIFAAQEYATRGPAPAITKPTDPSYNWAVPTSEGKPIAHSLLKTWILSKAVTAGAPGEFAVGLLERNARLPFALIAFLVTIGGFAWVRRYWGTKAGLMSALAFVSLPAIYLGVHNLASEMLFVATTTAAILAVTHLVYATERRVMWGAIVGILQVLAFMDQGLIGLYSIMAVVSAWCVTEIAFEQAVRYREGRPGILSKQEVAPSLVALASAILFLVGGWWWNESTEKALFEPHIQQLYMAVVPFLLFTSGILLGRRTRVGRAIIGPPGAMIGLITFIGCYAIGHAYGDANPTLLDGGEVVGKIPVLSFMLENHLFERSIVDSHMSFDRWLRQIGFSMIPWAALVPLGLGYLARSTRNEDTVDIDSPQEGLKRLMLVWSVFAGLVLVVASVYGHYFYPAYFPLAAAIGLMLSDREFWKEARLNSLLGYAMGFLACATIMMLGKDLERFPTRFVEVYTTLEKGFELPEDFAFGKMWKGIKYATFAILLVYFFSPYSWFILTLRNMKTWPSRFRAWRQSEDRWKGLWDPKPRPFVERAEAKEALRNEPGIVGRIALWLETPRYYAPFLAIYFAAIGVVFLVKWAPELTNHMSQRGVFETYVTARDDGEKLFRYGMPARDASVYLSDVDEIKNSRTFEQMFESDERFFAVIPRKNLARINFETRRKTKKNVPVLDARSSRLLLISNTLEEGEQDESFVSQHIFEEPPEIEYEILFETKDGKKEHPVFDDSLEMLGFNLDHKKDADGYASYQWGETAEIDYYFRVKKRVTSSQKIFLHVDYPGNRINGDHYPNDGEFPTNYWNPGDIVRSRQHLKIDNYATAGVYTLNFGFFIGSKRMKVEPREAHDGRNRITIGKFRIEPL